jgi:hypothetical protein
MRMPAMEVGINFVEDTKRYNPINERRMDVMAVGVFGLTSIDGISNVSGGVYMLITRVTIPSVKNRRTV